MHKIYKMDYDYNTSRKKMDLPEYGRNVQKMVDYIKTIEDKEERNKRITEAVIQCGYSQKEVADYLRMHYSTVSRLMAASN